MNVDFGLQDKLCNSEELKLPLRRVKILREVMIFFSELFNIKKTMLLKDYYNELEMRLTKQKQMKITL